MENHNAIDDWAIFDSYDSHDRRVPCKYQSIINLIELSQLQFIAANKERSRRLSPLHQKSISGNFDHGDNE